MLSAILVGMRGQVTLEKLYWLAGWTYDFSRYATVLLVIILTVNYFFCSVMVVRGESMLPTFRDGDVELVNRAVYDLSSPGRGDVIALKFPGEPHRQFIKRIVGLPGEQVTISGGRVSVNGRVLSENYLPDAVKTEPDTSRTLAANEYFVMGDNRFVSSDSRAWGSVPRSFIIGRVGTRLLSLGAKN